MMLRSRTLSFLVCLVSNSATLAAVSTAILAEIGVLIRKWMPIDAVGCFGFLSRHSIAAHNIFALGNWLKMGRIYAVSASAFVVKLEPVWDGAMHKFVCYTMRKLLAIIGKFPISIIGDRSIPNPATICLCNVLPEFLWSIAAAQVLTAWATELSTISYFVWPCRKGLITLLANNNLIHIPPSLITQDDYTMCAAFTQRQTPAKPEEIKWEWAKVDFADLHWVRSFDGPVYVS